MQVGSACGLVRKKKQLKIIIYCGDTYDDLDQTRMNRTNAMACTPKMTFKE